MPRFVEGPAIETAFSSGDETAAPYTSVQLISVTTGETHQRDRATSPPPGATTPVANARGEHVFICVRGETTRGRR